MKSQSVFKLFPFFFACLLTFSLNAQNDVTTDSTGFPGDGFSLEGALYLFQKSESPEDFEKLLNAENNVVNNLDLNEDGEVDYIRVVDNMSDKSHAITLQVPLNDKESQDIAVIGIEEQGKENAVLQIIGDADVYGEEVYVEPFEEETVNDGKGGPSADDRIARVIVNVYFWPCVRFVYRPTYVVYVSPWRWHYYPRYYRPWRPQPWHFCHSRRVTYHRHYHHTHVHRVTHAHRVYTPHRRTTKTVSTRTTTVKAVRGPAGNTAVKKTTTTKTSSTANKKANTANTKANTANKKASTANSKASTANKKANTANTKANKANKKAKTANNKTSTTNTKASVANKKTNAANTKAVSSKKSSHHKNKESKSSAHKSGKKGNTSGKKASNAKSSAKKSGKQRKSGGGKNR